MAIGRRNEMAQRIPLTLKEMLKPAIWTCGNCGGKLYVYPYTEGEGKNMEIKTINICPKCTFGKEG